MDLRIDFASLTSAAGNLQGILDATERSSTLAQGTTLGAGYSGMPELSALGAAHGPHHPQKLCPANRLGPL